MSLGFDLAPKGPFQSLFEVVPALDSALRDAAYRIRHSVYCEDLGWESRRPDGRETDEFDAGALHVLIRHLPSQRYIACVRLILGAAQRALPFEGVCAGLAPGAIPSQPPGRLHIAEVSRLAIIREFRRRRGEHNSPAPALDENLLGAPVPRFPHVLAGLYLGVIAAAALHDLDRLFVLTEPRLARHLDQLGLRILQIGPPVDHRGPRVPSMIEVNSLAAALRPGIRELYDHILDTMRHAHSRAAAASTDRTRAGDGSARS